LRGALLVVLAVLALAACGHTAETSDSAADERELMEFEGAPTSELRFFIDPASISVKDRVVRYTLVARSPTGATNITFEGMRCETGDVRVYALGREGGWMRSSADWRPIRPGWHRVLYREYFCPQREPIASAREGIDSLRRGGASITRSLTEDIPRGGSGAGF
jgi:hypothetical protein